MGYPTPLAPSCGFIHAAPGLMGKVSAVTPSHEGHKRTVQFLVA